MSAVAPCMFDLDFRPLKREFRVTSQSTSLMNHDGPNKLLVTAFLGLDLAK